MKKPLTLLKFVAIATGTLLAFGTASARPLGIDVSSFQGGGINWTSVHGAGISFAWSKATEGTYDDDVDFVGNINNGKAAGVVMGAYHFARPDLDSPATEAGFFWNAAHSFTLADGKTLMPMLDMETFNGVVGASSYSDWANQWNSDVTGYAGGQRVTLRPFIYTSACTACEFNTSVSGSLADIADYNGQNPQTGTPWSTCASCEEWGANVWSVWQYTSTGSIAGISGNVDHDVFNGTSISSVIAGSSGGLTNRVGMVSTTNSQGYWIVASDGGVFSFGNAVFYGSMGGQHLNAPIVGMAANPAGTGYWLVASDGGIFTFGSAGFYGSMGGQHINAPIVGMCSTASGNGYWLVGADGGIYAFGDAPFNGSMGGQHLNAPVVGMARNPGNGYWLVGSDGGIYSFGANFYGSMGGQHLNAPVVGMAASPAGTGYWLVGSDGGIYAFSVGFYGSMGGTHLSAPVEGMAGTSTAAGYWLVGHDGAIYSFGNAPYKGGANF